MRFILNFFFFGILFYVIWLFFPDAFKTLVSWADQVVTFVRGLVAVAAEKVHTAPAVPAAPVAPASALLMMLKF